jgi:hypothetical protein
MHLEVRQVKELNMTKAIQCPMQGKVSMLADNLGPPDG